MKYDMILEERLVTQYCITKSVVFYDHRHDCTSPEMKFFKFNLVFFIYGSTSEMILQWRFCSFGSFEICFTVVEYKDSRNKFKLKISEKKVYRL